MKFEGTDNDPCLFYNQSHTVMMTVFVDDGLIVAQNKDKVEDLLLKLARKFEITSEGLIQGMLYYLGVDIKLMRNCIFSSQSKYTKMIIEEFGFAFAYEVFTPMEPGMITNMLVNDKELKNEPYRQSLENG